MAVQIPFRYYGEAYEDGVRYLKCEFTGNSKVLSWLEAQNLSLQACQMLTKLEGQLSPITNLKDKNVLKKIWVELNSVSAYG